MDKEKIFGIDLGTTNSAIAYLDDEHLPRIITPPDGLPIVPSVVAFNKEQNRIIVGKEAKNYVYFDPENTVRSVKRLMGTNRRLSLGGNIFSPEEISSFILKHMVSMASETLGVQVKKVVISVPAYFNDAQRRATIKAGELAGLDVVRIINEPTAASLVYDYVTVRGREQAVQSDYLMVYDLGGGTFDISIVDIKGEVREVMASTGDTALGGDDFDERLAEFFMRHLVKEYGADIENDFILKIRLKDIAEKVKIALSERAYVHVKEPAVSVYKEQMINLNVEIKRSDFEEMTRDLLINTMDKTFLAIKEAGLEPSAIERVLMVGGSTRMPMVQDALASVFQADVGHFVDPDHCVSMGAAIHGGLIAGEPLGRILLDVTAHSLGIKTIDKVDETGDADYFAVIIPRNTRIPVKRTRMFYTMVEKQPEVVIEVYQGESYSCAENTLVGEFLFALKPSPYGTPVIVEFAYDLEGIVHITIEQKGYDNRKEVTLNIRKRVIIQDDQNGSDKAKGLAPVNYIAQKANGLLKSPVLEDKEREDMEHILNQYEEAIRQDKDEDVIDDLEERLLDYIAMVEDREEES